MAWNPLLTQEVNVTSSTFTADYRGMIKCDCTSNAIAVTLPNATFASGAVYVIKKSDSSAHAVTIGTTASQTIDGASTQTLSAQYSEMGVFSDGQNWNIIGNYVAGGGVGGVTSAISFTGFSSSVIGTIPRTDSSISDSLASSISSGAS